MENFEDNIIYQKIDEKWKALYAAGETIDFYFKSRKLHKIAICGMGYLTLRIIDDLKSSKLSVEYLISSNQTERLNSLKVFKIGEELPAVDIIVVTELENYLITERMLCEKNCIEVISIQEVLDKSLRTLRL